MGWGEPTQPRSTLAEVVLEQMKHLGEDLAAKDADLQRIDERLARLSERVAGLSVGPQRRPGCHGAGLQLIDAVARLLDAVRFEIEETLLDLQEPAFGVEQRAAHRERHTEQAKNGGVGDRPGADDLLEESLDLAHRVHGTRRPAAAPGSAFSAEQIEASWTSLSETLARIADDHAAAAERIDRLAAQQIDPEGERRDPTGSEGVGPVVS